jgi:hypothetical protein
VRGAKKGWRPTAVRRPAWRTEAPAELRVDAPSIEPIPEADKDSTGAQHMWIWAGTNIAPINRALGALGIVRKLGLWERSWRSSPG